MNTQSNLESEAFSPSSKPKKKRILWLILIFLLLLSLGVGTAGYYFYQRQLPEKAVEDFLQDMKQMDFEGMAAHLQSSDLSALDHADIRNKAFEDFFRQINQKMSYTILKNHFDFQNDTAEISVRIKYIDGTNIYREAISEFLRKIVSAALSGEDVSQAQMQAEEQLASILTQKAESIEDTYTEMDLTYPLIRENGDWKIVALNDDTVKIMSANFKNAAEEIHKTLNDNIPETEDDTSDTKNADSAADENEEAEEPVADAQENSEVTSSENLLTLTTADFTVEYVKHKKATDCTGAPCFLFFYNYTNNSDSPSSAMVDVDLRAFQNDTALSAAILSQNEKSIDLFFHEVEPGETVTVCQAFSLDGTSDVTVQVKDTSGSEENTSSQIFNLKK